MSLVSEFSTMTHATGSQLAARTACRDTAGLTHLPNTPLPPEQRHLRLTRQAAERPRMGDDFELWNQLEHDFHSQLYALSSMNLVRGELERL